MSIGFIQGGFDLFHIGHIIALEKAKARCDKLIVGLNSDRLIKKYKFKSSVLNFSLRKKCLLSLKSVNQVVSISTASPLPYLKKNKPDIFFICNEWKFNKKFEIEFMQSIGHRCIILPYYKGISSSSIRDKQIKSLIMHNSHLCAVCHRKM